MIAIRIGKKLEERFVSRPFAEDGTCLDLQQLPRIPATTQFHARIWKSCQNVLRKFEQHNPFFHRWSMCSACSSKCAVKPKQWTKRGWVELQNCTQSLWTSCFYQHIVKQLWVLITWLNTKNKKSALINISLNNTASVTVSVNRLLRRSGTFLAQLFISLGTQKFTIYHNFSQKNSQKCERVQISWHCNVG